MARNFHRLPSEIVKAKNEVAALDFNRACSLRLLHWDNERNNDNLEAIGKMIGLSFGADSEEPAKKTRKEEVW
jgi:hypothetical protein